MSSKMCTSLYVDAVWCLIEKMLSTNICKEEYHAQMHVSFAVRYILKQHSLRWHLILLL